MFDGIILPFTEDSVSENAISDVRHLSAARALVFDELRSSSSALAALEEVQRRASFSQDRNRRLYEEFVSALRRHSSSDAATTSSPISGVTRAFESGSGCGLLDAVVVAPPPLTLRGVNENFAGRPGSAMHTLVDQYADLDDDEKPLLQSSPNSSGELLIGETPVWTQQQAASQSSLDGVFFEALVSQQLNLSLWMRSANPDESLHAMLGDVMKMEQARCEETVLADVVNAARFVEQQTYKRRRDELAAQAAKSREKVRALEKLLRVASDDVAPTRCPAAKDLATWLQD